MSTHCGNSSRRIGIRRAVDYCPAKRARFSFTFGVLVFTEQLTARSHTPDAVITYPLRNSKRSDNRKYISPESLCARMLKIFLISLDILLFLGRTLRDFVSCRGIAENHTRAAVKNRSEAISDPSPNSRARRWPSPVTWIGRSNS